MNLSRPASLNQLSTEHQPPSLSTKVEFVMEKPKGAKFDVGGVLYDKVRLTMVLDGYTAPVTAGTIVDLIQKGKAFFGAVAIIMMVWGGTCFFCR